MLRKKIVDVLFEFVVWGNAHKGVLTSLLHVHDKLDVTLICESSNGADPEAIAVHSALPRLVVGGHDFGDTRRIGYIRMTKPFGDRMTNPRKAELFQHIEAVGGKLDADLVFFDKVDLACRVELLTDVEVELDEFGIEDDHNF